MNDPICNEHAPKPHNEEICHATGEKRKNIVEKLKKFLEEVDDRPCLLKEARQSPRRNDDVKELLRRQLVKKCSLKDKLQPNDHDHQHHHHNPGFQMREGLDKGNPISIKPAMVIEYYRDGDNCENYDKGMKRFANNHQTQIPARKQMISKKNDQPVENFYKDCSCLRANGLQDQCPLLDCQGKEECLAVNPGPCCKPALTLLCEMQQEKLQREAAKIIADYGGNFQNVSQEDSNKLNKMQYEENPKTLACFCYYN